MLNPPITGIADLDAHLYDLHINDTDSNSIGYSSNPITGEITNASGIVVGYLYQFIHIKYGIDNIGGGFSDSPTNKYYYGIHNSSSSVESTNPADYTWYSVAGGFGVGFFLFYQVLGGRQIKFDVNTLAIDYKWLPAPITAVSLDNLIPVKTITFNELMDGTVKELQLADDAVTAAKLNVAAISGITGELVTNSVGETQITTDAVTSQKIKANAVVAGKIDADAISARELQTDSIIASKIKAGEVTASKINVLNLAAINANMGSITAGNISGSTFYGGAASAYATGTGMFSGVDSTTYKFRVGNPAGNNMSWDGTNLNIVGGGTFSGNLSAAGGTFSGSLNAVTGSFGVVDITSTGNIKSGQTDFNTGTGFWLGNSAGTPKFSVGISSGKRLSWDGNSLYVSGSANTIITSNNSERSVAGYLATIGQDPTTWTYSNIHSLSITTTGGPVNLSAVVRGVFYSYSGGQGGNVPIAIRIRRDTNTIYYSTKLRVFTSGGLTYYYTPGLAYSQNAPPSNFFVTDIPTSGTHTYYFDVCAAFIGSNTASTAFYDSTMLNATEITP